MNLAELRKIRYRRIPRALHRSSTTEELAQSAKKLFNLVELDEYRLVDVVFDSERDTFQARWTLKDDVDVGPRADRLWVVASVVQEALVLFDDPETMVRFANKIRDSILNPVT